MRQVQSRKELPQDPKVHLSHLQGTGPSSMQWGLGKEYLPLHHADARPEKDQNGELKLTNEELLLEELNVPVDTPSCEL